MMRKPAPVVLALAGAVLVSVLPDSRAEVSVDVASSRPTTILMSVTDGVDPISHLRWQAYRPVPNARLLNPDGDLRQDGPPAVAWHEPSGWPVVVWAYKAGADHDVAIARWTGSSWGSIEFLTSSTEDERDPRVFVERNGTIHVAWWVDGPDRRVMLATLLANDVTWLAPVRVSPPEEAGMRPTVAVLDGGLHVAYERVRLGEAQPASSGGEIVVRSSGLDGFAEEDAAVALAFDALEPLLHVRDGRLWMDWRHSSTAFAYRELRNGSWTATEVVPWSDPSWVGVEMVRRLIERQVLAAP
jgi:hypothetical protein